jgi:hypothetical protein
MDEGKVMIDGMVHDDGESEEGRAPEFRAAYSSER